MWGDPWRFESSLPHPKTAPLRRGLSFKPPDPRVPVEPSAPVRDAGNSTIPTSGPYDRPMVRRKRRRAGPAASEDEEQPRVKTKVAPDKLASPFAALQGVRVPKKKPAIAQRGFVKLQRLLL